MVSEDAVVFIDCQLYIDLYRTESGKELLALLQEEIDHIFITEQIVNEVNRHKLQEAIGFFQRKDCQIGKAPGGKLPNHLFDDSGGTRSRVEVGLFLRGRKPLLESLVLVLIALPYNTAYRCKGTNDSPRPPADRRVNVEGYLLGL